MGAVDEPRDPREEVRLTLVQEWSNLFFLNIVSHLIFFYCKVSKKQTKELLKTRKENCCFMTTGNDRHSRNKPQEEQQRRRGGASVDDGHLGFRRAFSLWSR